MGVVKYATGIDYVSGSLAKPTKKNGHKCGTYLIGTHRNAATTNQEGCTRLYVRNEDAYNRSTPVTTDEMAARMRFRMVAQAVAARRKDLQQISPDHIAFLAQKDEPGGKPTMQSYLWKLEGDKYDAEHNG